MSGTKWVVRRPEKSMPQVWDQHGKKCVTDRVFDGHEDLLAAAPELRDATVQLGKLVQTFMTGGLVTADEAQRALDVGRNAIAKAEGRAS